MVTSYDSIRGAVDRICAVIYLSRVIDKYKYISNHCAQNNKFADFVLKGWMGKGGKSQGTECSCFQKSTPLPFKSFILAHFTVHQCTQQLYHCTKWPSLHLNIM